MRKEPISTCSNKKLKKSNYLTCVIRAFNTGPHYSEGSLFPLFIKAGLKHTFQSFCFSPLNGLTEMCPPASAATKDELSLIKQSLYTTIIQLSSFQWMLKEHIPDAFWSTSGPAGTGSGSSVWTQCFLLLAWIWQPLRKCMSVPTRAHGTSYMGLE